MYIYLCYLYKLKELNKLMININCLLCLNIDFIVRDIEYEIFIFNSFKNI